MTEVVAALIWNGDRFLACQRPAHKTRGLLWEFVGGKVEAGESHQEALIRECREELAVTVNVTSVFMEVTHEYPDMTVHLTLFNASIVSGEPQLLEHNAFAWVKTDEIDSFCFCPADVEILEKLKSVRNALDAHLFALADPVYRSFQCKLMPGIDTSCVLGVRTPDLRKLAKELQKRSDLTAFLNTLPHRYYEEDNLHALRINAMIDYSEAVTALNLFLPYVNNWATCDMLSPRAFQHNPAGLLQQVDFWLASEHPYARRFAIGVLMKYYLEKYFSLEHFKKVLQTNRDSYYVKLMVAWYFATALAKQYDAAVQVLECHLLDTWTHNKTIQKAMESYRISSEKKAYLRTLKNYKKEGNHNA